jgi:hypothetical protein
VTATTTTGTRPKKPQQSTQPRELTLRSHFKTQAERTEHANERKRRDNLRQRRKEERFANYAVVHMSEPNRQLVESVIRTLEQQQHNSSKKKNKGSSSSSGGNNNNKSLFTPFEKTATDDGKEQKKSDFAFISSSFSFV